MSVPLTSAHYSAIIKMELQVGDRSFRVAQAASDFIITDAPLSLPPGPATLLVNVEGETTRREIDLPNGAQSDSCRIPIIRR